MSEAWKRHGSKLNAVAAKLKEICGYDSETYQMMGFLNSGTFTVSKLASSRPLKGFVSAEWTVCRALRGLWRI